MKDQTDNINFHKEFYFPTTIFFRDLPNSAPLNAALLTAIRAERDADASGIGRSNIPHLGGWHSKTNLHQKAPFADFRETLTATANEIGNSIGYDPAWELAIDNLWSIINLPGSYNRSHIHPNALWSGVYYVQVPKNSGRIVFTDPRTQALCQQARFVPDRPRSAENWTEVFFEPVAGRMILFPNWLYHEVEANRSEAEGPDAERVILSFNLFQRRKPRTA